MANISSTLKAIDANLNLMQPSTMDELINIVHSTEGVGNYGTHFTIVKHMGYIQGIRVYLSGRTKSHVLPSKNKVYSVFKGLDHFIKAGWIIEND